MATAESAAIADSGGATFCFRRYSSLNNLPNVGLCFAVFSFFFAGAVRVGGVVPSTLRESAFTAVTARNRFFLGAMQQSMAESRPDVNGLLPRH